MCRRISRSVAMLAVMWVAVTGWIPIAAHGLDLGGLMVHSGQGDPLRLTLSVTAVSADESESLTVTLASRSDYAEAGVAYPLLAEDLRFEQVSQGQGKHQVVITTDQAVEDSIVRLLLSATRSGGRMVREYVVMLTPPEPEDRIVLPESSDRPEFRRPQTPVTPGGEMRVVWGDTLSHIVQRLGLPDELHRFQGYLAVLLANPEAFVNNNMHRLRSDVTLKIPTWDEIALVSYSDSVSAYSEQLARFAAYRHSLRQHQVVDPEPVVTDRVPGPETGTLEEGAPEAMDPKVETPLVAEVEQDPVPPEPEPESDDPAVDVEPPEGRLVIRQEVGSELAVNDPGDSQTTLDTLETGLALLDESLLASDQESGNVLQSLKQLRKQSEDISQLIGIEVEDAGLAAMQQRIQERQGGRAADNADTGPTDASGDLSSSMEATTTEEAAQDEFTLAEEGTTERDVGLPSGQAALETTNAAGRADQTEAAMGAEAECESVSTPGITSTQPDAPISSGEVPADPMSSPSAGVPESEAESEGKILPKPDSGSDEVLSVQEDVPLSSTGMLQEESTGASELTETHRSGIQDDVLNTIRSMFSILPEYGQKIAVGLLVLLAGLFFWQRRKTRRTDHQDTSEPGTPAA